MATPAVLQRSNYHGTRRLGGSKVELLPYQGAEYFSLLLSRISVMGAAQDQASHLWVQGIKFGNVSEQKMGDLMADDVCLMGLTGVPRVIDPVLGQMLLELPRSLPGRHLPGDEYDRTSSLRTKPFAQLLHRGVRREVRPLQQGPALAPCAS
ncbi:hypothetical protein AC230_00850 [Streptomyces caatingaensis]|uniref:Uncharacterized protein n=1 Tax=Streptomyces caatingaensis TaxID=1678637 RepID=A0A0K9XJ17_9ACTN|nr:hypothetical protein AC230_00850 [Streptomyces caatingaensis]